MKLYYLLECGQTAGPFSSEQIVKRIKDAEIDATHLVWAEGMSNWIPISDCEEICILIDNKSDEKHILANNLGFSSSQNTEENTTCATSKQNAFFRNLWMAGLVVVFAIVTLFVIYRSSSNSHRPDNPGSSDSSHTGAVPADQICFQDNNSSKDIQSRLNLVEGVFYGEILALQDDIKAITDWVNVNAEAHKVYEGGGLASSRYSHMGLEEATKKMKALSEELSAKSERGNKSLVRVIEFLRLTPQFFASWDGNEQLKKLIQGLSEIYPKIKAAGGSFTNDDLLMIVSKTSAVQEYCRNPNVVSGNDKVTPSKNILTDTKKDYSDKKNHEPAEKSQRDQKEKEDLKRLKRTLESLNL